MSEEKSIPGAVEEGFVSVPGGKVWYRRVKGGARAPLLVLHGGPGFTHHYLTAMDDLADERDVIYYDQLGCGNSDRPGDKSLWTVERYVDELEEVRRSLGLDHCHLIGNSWGGMLGMAYAIDRQPELVSLAVSNSPASMPRYASENQELKAKLPEEIQETIEWHEARGFTDCPEYQGAIAVWFRRHVCRMRPWPEGLERAFATMGTDVYLHMVGPSEFFITGTLAKWDVTERLSEIAVPTLFISGEYDAIRPAHVRDMHERLPGSKLINYEQSSHLPFEEEREQFMADYREFMAATESASHRV